MTMEQLKVALPTKFKTSVNQDLLDNINNTISDPESYEIYRDNLLSFTHVLQDGKFKITSYIDAVRYVSFKLMGKTNIASYSLAFPDKIARFNTQGVSSKDVASYSTAYHKSKLVGLLLAQTLTPCWVLNQDLYQQALNVQAELMLNAKSEKVRTDAANSLLTQLKQPEAQKIELDVSVKEDNVIGALRASTLELVAQQRLAIASGAIPAQDIAHSKLIVDAPYEEVTIDESEATSGQSPTNGGVLFK